MESLRQSPSKIPYQTQVYSNLMALISTLLENEDDTACCVYDKFTPDEVRRSQSAIFTRWVACDQCYYGTHLI